MGAALAGGAQADENSVTLTQEAAQTGQVRIDITTTYVFPGLPPRNGNFGLGTVRITLPQATISLDPANPPDAGYNCFVADVTVTCSNDGQPSATGLTFPTSLTVHLLSPACYSPADPTGAEADVWSAPNDAGSAPDVSLPISPGSDCGGGIDQPVLDGHAAPCIVPKLVGATLASAKRQVRNAHCALGKVTYARSKKVKKGRVISQSLKAKKSLKPGTRVSFVVSKGP
jgi:hypothetical protein